MPRAHFCFWRREPTERSPAKAPQPRPGWKKRRSSLRSQSFWIAFEDFVARACAILVGEGGAVTHHLQLVAVSIAVAPVSKADRLADEGPLAGGYLVAKHGLRRAVGRVVFHKRLAVF